MITLLGVFGGRMFLAGLCSGFGTSSRILNSEDMEVSFWNSPNLRFNIVEQTKDTFT